MRMASASASSPHVAAVQGGSKGFPCAYETQGASFQLCLTGPCKSVYKARG